MDELTELRKRKLELYQQQYTAALQSKGEEAEQMHQQIQQLEVVMKQMMSSDALQRYGTVKLAHPEKALQALVVLAQRVQAGGVGVIDDSLLKNVLLALNNKREPWVNVHGAV